MLKKLEVRDPNSCLNKAERDEPIFVLRANDELAPEIVREWADVYIDSKRRRNRDREMTQAQIDKYNEALTLADQMEEWKRQQSNDNTHT